MISTVVILLQTVVTERYVERLGALALSDKFHVRIFDMTPWLKPAFWRDNSETRYQGPEYQAIFNRVQFEREIAMISDAVVLDYLEPGRPQDRVRRILKERGILRAVLMLGLLPAAKVPSFNARVRAALTPRLPWRMWAKVRQIRLSPPLAPDILIHTGEAGVQLAPGPKMHNIAAHGPDYDEFLYLDAMRGEPGNYAVYIDEDMLHHPDYAYVHLPCPVTGERFYSRLNAFFDAFEAHSGIKTIVAAHPRSRYEIRPELLRGREAVRGQTASLIRDAVIVFAHSSTALSFVALWQKPVVFLTSDEIDGSWMSLRIHKRAELFEAPLVNLDTFCPGDINLSSWLSSNVGACKYYVRQFVKMPGTPEMPLWSIVSDYIRQHL